MFRSMIHGHSPSGGKQWFNLSWLWNVIASVYLQRTKFHRPHIVCGCVRRGYRRLSYVRLPPQRRFDRLPFVFPFYWRVCFTPLSSAFPNIYLAASPNTVHNVVLRHILGECLKERGVFFAACDHDPVGQSAWRLFAWSFLLSAFLAAWLCSDGIGQF